jgi:hypothetical protein
MTPCCSAKHVSSTYWNTCTVSGNKSIRTNYSSPSPR